MKYPLNESTLKNELDDTVSAAVRKKVVRDNAMKLYRLGN